MIEYRIVQGFGDVQGFEAKVNKALDQGWKLQAGVCVARDGLYQAMTRAVSPGEAADKPKETQG